MRSKDIQRKFTKGIALLIRFIKNPSFTYDDFIHYEFEKKRGIITRGFVAESELGISADIEPYHYVPGGNIYLKRVLKKLKITEIDTGIDLGCGLGSVMLYMYQFPFRKISGVEFSLQLYNQCKVNLEKLGSKRLEVYYGDAAEFNHYDEYNYIFMFNPFGRSTMKKVLKRISESYDNNPRQITLIYKNPMYSDEVISTGIFIKVTEYNTESEFNFSIFKTK